MYLQIILYLSDGKMSPIFHAANFFARMQFLIYVQRFATEVLQHIAEEKRKRKEDSLMQENLGKRVLLSITAWEPLMMLGAVGLSLIRQLRKQTLTKQALGELPFSIV